MLEEIVKTEKLEEDNLARTRCHSSAFFPRRHPTFPRRYPTSRCGCSRYPEPRNQLGRRIPEWALRYPSLKRFFEGLVTWKRRDSLNENEADDGEEATMNQETNQMMQLPRSRRGSRGFNFGGTRGGWRNINWGNLGGRNNCNSNNGGLWNRCLLGVGFSLFGNRAGTSTPPRSDSLPDLSTGRLHQGVEVRHRPPWR